MVCGTAGLTLASHPMRRRQGRSLRDPVGGLRTRTRILEGSSAVRINMESQEFVDCGRFHLECMGAKAVGWLQGRLPRGERKCQVVSGGGHKALTAPQVPSGPWTQSNREGRP